MMRTDRLLLFAVLCLCGVRAGADPLTPLDADFGAGACATNDPSTAWPVQPTVVQTYDLPDQMEMAQSDCTGPAAGSGENAGGQSVPQFAALNTSLHLSDSDLGTPVVGDGQPALQSPAILALLRPPRLLSSSC